MTKQMIKIVNVETGEEIEREMNAEELAEHEASKIANQVFKAELEAKATARQALLDKLGITAEEAQLLLGGN